MSTWSPVTFGETADEVCSRLNTIQGWRPISVKIQPTVIASSGSGAAQMATLHIQGFVIRRPPRVNQRPPTATAMAAMPKPIIQRKAQ